MVIKMEPIPIPVDCIIACCKTTLIVKRYAKGESIKNLAQRNKLPETVIHQILNSDEAKFIRDHVILTPRTS